RLKRELISRVKEPFNSAIERVKAEHDALQVALERLYRRSIADLEAHKLSMEKPFQSCLKVLEGHTVAVEKVESCLKELLRRRNGDSFLNTLGEVMEEAEKVLSACGSLDSISFPKASKLKLKDFPAGRLHNVTIAPRRSGDRDRA
ncbi:unnamed protein product, partial [Discosporangium mesarthrocarpum]